MTDSALTSLSSLQQELLDIAAEVAARAAELARVHRESGVGDVATKSTPTDLVTTADRAVERLMVGLLAGYRPADTVLGEESGDLGPGTTPVGGAAPPSDAVHWVIDPIDGTVNYVYGLGHCAVSIAAHIAGRAEVGVVHHITTDEQWHAVRGVGAWRGSTALTGSTVARLEQALVATGFAYSAARRAHQAAVLARVLPLVRDIRRFGAASLDMCYAAEGRVDAYFERGLGAWDHAAGGLIATEAGLVVSGLRGAPPGPAMVLAAPPALHPPLHDLLAGLNADAAA